MILLMDLDGTLLSNSMGRFQAPYFKALGDHLEPLVSPDVMLPALITGTRRMLENQDPLVTLETAFDRHFYPALGFEKPVLDERIMDFYDTRFPSLGKLTHQLPEAIDFVRSRLLVGDRIIVATNPLFPRVATLARLVWAGLPADNTDFDLITTYEFMHFSKSQPAYYAEILAYLGYPDEAVMMIGNDLSDDMQPSGSLGIPGFWLTSAEPLPDESADYQPSGTYHDLVAHLKHDYIPVDVYDTDSVPVLITFLTATLAALHGYQLVLGRQPGAALENLGRLVAQRYQDEKSLVGSHLYHDTLLQNRHETNSFSDINTFARYRLDWIRNVSSPGGSSLNLSEPDRISLLQASIVNDRKMLMECAQWLKHLPEITHKFISKPC